MTKLEELRVAYDAATEAAVAACDAAYAAAGAAYDAAKVAAGAAYAAADDAWDNNFIARAAYYDELRKIQKENPND
jgi:hypothetical protein